MTWRMSSGSSRAESAVEPTRSQNMTVSWRRSAASTDAVGSGAGAALEGPASCAAAARIFRRCPTLAGDADLLQIVGGDVGEDGRVDLVIRERRLVLPE